jgi:hypothetical protein
MLLRYFPNYFEMVPVIPVIIWIINIIIIIIIDLIKLKALQILQLCSKWSSYELKCKSLLCRQNNFFLNLYSEYKIYFLLFTLRSSQQFQ